MYLTIETCLLLSGMRFKSINKEIFKIAIPNILGNITIPLIGIVDTVLMGHQPKDATVLIGAIALGGVIFNAIYWNFGFLRVGTTGITAQAFGAEDEQKQALTFFRAILLGALIAIILLILKPVISDLGFDLLRNEKNNAAINYAKDYFNIRIWAVPAVMVLYGFRGWFYGMQNAVYPLILTTVVNVINILGSIYFVKVHNMTADGVALGTVVAQYVCLLVAVILMVKKYQWIQKYIKLKLILLLDQLKEFFFVSGFVFGRNIMLFLVFAAFTYYSSAVGEEYFAINQMLLELFYLMSFAVDGFAYASEALVGKYTGSRQSNKLQEAINWTMIWGIGFGVVYAIAYFFAGEHFLRIFTPNLELIVQAKPYILWLCAISIVGAVAFIWDGIYIGATLVVQMFVCMTISTISFFIVFYLLRNSHPKHAIWAAMTSYMLVRGVMQWIFYEYLKKQGQHEV